MKKSQVNKIFKAMNVAGKWFKVAIKGEEDDFMKKFGQTGFCLTYVIVSANSIWMGNIGSVGKELSNEELKALIPSFSVIKEVRLETVGYVAK